jgi:integrase
MGAACRPLSDAEIDQVKGTLDNARDKALFILGVRTGFRVSELIQVRVMDLWQFGKPKESLTVAKAKMKGKGASRTVSLHDDAKRAVSQLILEYDLKGTDYLFKSQKGLNSHISRSRAWSILKDAFKSVEIGDGAATHSMRKTFALKVYNASDRDIRLTQVALGHASVDSTIKYLAVDIGIVNDLVKNLK